MATIPRTHSATTTMDVSHSPLARLAGPLTLIAGTLFIIVKLVLAITLDRSQRAASMAQPLFVPSAIANFVAYCALLLALTAMYEWQAHRAGTLGVISFIAVMIGTICMAGDMWFEAFVVPWLGDVAFDVLLKPSGTLILGALITYVLFTLGWLLFGIASLRARAMPAVIALAFMIGGAALPWVAELGGIPLGLAFTALGVWILRTNNSADKRF